MTKMVEVISESIPNQEEGNKLLEKLVAVASPEAVFGDPVEAGEYKVITASEVSVAMGMGYGGGGALDTRAKNSDEEMDKPDNPAMGVGSGGGGGGVSAARPVAAIEIGPHGIRVEPIVDPTKIALAFFTTLLSIFVMGSKMRRKMRR